MKVDFSILNQRGTPMFFQDTLANRPAAGVTGRLFVRTDSPFGVYRDTGTSWEIVASTTGGGGSQDLNSVMANGSFLNANYEIELVAASTFGIKQTDGYNNFYVNNTGLNDATYFGLLNNQSVSPTDGCYFAATKTTMHGHYRTTGGAERLFFRFNRSSNNTDLGHIDGTAPMFLRFNNTGSNREVSLNYNGSLQGLYFNFDNNLGYFGNITAGIDNSIYLQSLLNPDDTTAGIMQTIVGTAEYGFRIERNSPSNVRKITLGDVNGIYSTSRIEIDNSPAEITLITDAAAGVFRVEANGNAPIFNTPTSTDPYTPTTTFWKVEINGVQYGIPLYEYNP